MFTHELSGEPVAFNEGIRDDVLLAARGVYEVLAERKRTDVVNAPRSTFCYEAADLLVEKLQADGHNATHVIGKAEAVVAHSYVTLNTGTGHEIVVDPTWQQLLPSYIDSATMPEVLMGTRGRVVGQARHFGVDASTAKIWQEENVTMDAAAQRQENQVAEAAADLADQEGRWEAFMSQGR